MTNSNISCGEYGHTSSSKAFPSVWEPDICNVSREKNTSLSQFTFLIIIINERYQTRGNSLITSRQRVILLNSKYILLWRQYLLSLIAPAFVISF